MRTLSTEEQERFEQLIKECPVCYVGMTMEDGSPYVIPMSFGYEKGVLYLHSAQEGSVISILEKNPKVCITFCTPPLLLWQHEEVACSYGMRADSALCYGKVAFEEEYDEKVRALNLIMQHYTERDFSYSTPAVNGVRIWKVAIEKLSIREFGAPSKNALRFRSSRVL